MTNKTEAIFIMFMKLVILGIGHLIISNARTVGDIDASKLYIKNVKDFYDVVEELHGK